MRSHLNYELPKSVNFNNNLNTVDFIVTVPTQSTAEINNSTGRVSVAGLQGEVAIDNKFGDISVEKVDGPLDIRTNSGGIDVNMVSAGQGNIALNSGFGADLDEPGQRHRCHCPIQQRQTGPRKMSVPPGR